MREATLNHANRLSKLIKDARSHLEKTKEIRKSNLAYTDMKTARLAMWDRRQGCWKELEQPAALAMPADKILDLYEQQLAQDIAETEQELAQLTDATCPTV